MEEHSFTCMWELLNPSVQYNDRRDACRAFWNSITLFRKRQIYWYLREQKRRGEPIKENPLFALRDCDPQPTNWNGRQGINDMMKTEKMVSAYYPESGKYGIYTLQEAELFEMKEIKPLNFQLCDEVICRRKWLATTALPCNA